jgi:hypothetical protein
MLQISWLKRRLRGLVLVVIAVPAIFVNTWQLPPAHAQYEDARIAEYQDALQIKSDLQALNKSKTATLTVRCKPLLKHGLDPNGITPYRSLGVYIDDVYAGDVHPGITKDFECTTVKKAVVICVKGPWYDTTSSTKPIAFDVDPGASIDLTVDVLSYRCTSALFGRKTKDIDPNCVREKLVGMFRSDVIRPEKGGVDDNVFDGFIYELTLLYCPEVEDKIEGFLWTEHQLKNNVAGTLVWALSESKSTLDILHPMPIKGRKAERTVGGLLFKESTISVELDANDSNVIWFTSALCPKGVRCKRVPL